MSICLIRKQWVGEKLCLTDMSVYSKSSFQHKIPFALKDKRVNKSVKCWKHYWILPWHVLSMWNCRRKVEWFASCHSIRKPGSLHSPAYIISGGIGCISFFGNFVVLCCSSLSYTEWYFVLPGQISNKTPAPVFLKWFWSQQELLSRSCVGVLYPVFSFPTWLLTR